MVGVARPVGAPEPLGWRVLVDLGGAAFLCLALVAAAVTHLIRRRNVRPVLVAGGWIVAIEAVIWLAKITIGRTPPRSGLDLVFHGGMSYPSGHAADAVAVAISNVQLHYHWPTDAVAGWALGLAAGTLARPSLRRAAPRPA